MYGELKYSSLRQKLELQFENHTKSYVPKVGIGESTKYHMMKKGRKKKKETNDAQSLFLSK